MINIWHGDPQRKVRSQNLKLNMVDEKNVNETLQGRLAAYGCS